MAPGRYTQAAIAPGTALTSGHLVEDTTGLWPLGPCQARTPGLEAGAGTLPIGNQPERPGQGPRGGARDITLSSTHPCWPQSPGLALPLCPDVGFLELIPTSTKDVCCIGHRQEPSRYPAQSPPTLSVPPTPGLFQLQTGAMWLAVSLGHSPSFQSWPPPGPGAPDWSSSHHPRANTV